MLFAWRPSKDANSLGRSLDKVILLLEALELQRKNVRYYALDLSAEELDSTIRAIPIEKFKHVQITALHGNFDDGLLWLRNTPEVRDLPHCLLLFGLTIGNYSRENAATFLSKIISNNQATTRRCPTSIILSLDSCKNPSKILRAYNATGVVPFALQALQYGNVLLSTDKEIKDNHVRNIFRQEEWYFLSHWNYVLGRHEASLIPRINDVKLEEPLDHIVVGKEETVRFGCSYKYDEGERQALFESAGLDVVSEWTNESCDVGFYKLQARRLDLHKA